MGEWYIYLFFHPASVYAMTRNEQVAHVHHPPMLLPGFLCYGKNLATEMLKAGWAVTYDQVQSQLLLPFKSTELLLHRLEPNMGNQEKKVISNGKMKQSTLNSSLTCII